MSGKLLTIIQAAAFLGVTKATLYNWRVRGKGPAWVELSDDRPAASRPRQSRIRYDTDDLLRFQRRVEGKLDLVKPLQQRVHLPSQPLLSDAQWAIVDAALRWEGKMGRLAGTRYMDRARSELEALLAVAMEGAAKEAEGFIRRGGATENMLMRWMDDGWLEVAFRALSDDPDFHFTMIKQVLVMPHQPRPAVGSPGLYAAARMRTELVGPPPGHKVNAEPLTPATVAPSTVSAVLDRKRAARYIAGKKRLRDQDVLRLRGRPSGNSAPDGSTRVREP